MTLPPFDQDAVDRRFLDEVYRLHAAGAIPTFRELASNLQAQDSIIPMIESGRYHCNVKLLYLLDAHYDIDLLYILRGEGSESRTPVPRPVLSVGRPSKVR